MSAGGVGPTVLDDVCHRPSAGRRPESAGQRRRAPGGCWCGRPSPRVKYLIVRVNMINDHDQWHCMMIAAIMINTMVEPQLLMLISTCRRRVTVRVRRARRPPPPPPVGPRGSGLPVDGLGLRRQRRRPQSACRWHPKSDATSNCRAGLGPSVPVAAARRTASDIAACTGSAWHHHQ